MIFKFCFFYLTDKQMYFTKLYSWRAKTSKIWFNMARQNEQNSKKSLKSSLWRHDDVIEYMTNFFTLKCFFPYK